MAKLTTSYMLTPTWTQVASAGQTVYLQNQRGSQIYYAFGATAPAAGGYGHVLNREERIGEPAMAAHLWARTVGGNAEMSASVGGTAVASIALVTSSVDLSATWTRIATAGQSIRIDCISGRNIRWAYAAAAPTAGALTGHILEPGDEYVDPTADQDIWARSEGPDANTASATIVITKGP